ncbi:MAG: xylulokinase [Deinococcales bacterium]
MNSVSIGIDLGTSGVKVIALAANGTSVAESHASYPLLTPQPGWTEQLPSDWFSSVLVALKALQAQLEGRYTPVALGIAGQMHGAVFLDQDLRVLRPAPLWNDQRTGAACAEIETAIPRTELIQRTGNIAVTGFQLPKLLWLRQAEPEHFAKVRHVLLPKDYLNLKLTGAMATEPSDASGVGALNLATLEWDTDVLGALSLDSAVFPAIQPSHSIVGYLLPEIAHETGLPVGTPVVAGASDNAGAQLGLGISSARAGVGSVSLGTSGVIVVPLEQARAEPEGRVHLFCHADGGYFFLGCTLSAAGSLQWFRDTLAKDVAFDALMLEAAQAPSGADGLSFMPYLAGERSPHLNPDLRGAWLGLSLAHTRGHMVRAILEGVAFSLRQTLAVMKPIVRVEKLLSVGGGMRSELWRGIVASALDLPLEQPALEEGPARGAAILGLVGAGLFPDIAAALKATAPSTEIVQVVSSDIQQAFERYEAGFAAVLGFSR